MNAETILKQIISDQQQEGLSGFNIAQAIDNLLVILNKREQEVVKSRFGLGGFNKATLEAIGKKHQLTRERVRQIETSSVAKLKKAKESEATLNLLRQLLVSLAEEHSGVMDKQYFFDLLFQLSADTSSLSKEAHGNYADFALTKLLDDSFVTIKNSQYFSNSVRLLSCDLDKLESVAEELITHIKNLRKLLLTEELLDLIVDLESYKKHTESLTPVSKIDFKELLSRVVPDYSDKVYNNRHLYNLLQTLDELEQNRFFAWGHKKWREVSPKTINDKIYLVLKNEGKPMYYGDIAKKIAEMGFDTKDVNVATTHNELILDDKYVLVGRGLYGLKEWGYQSGTVTEVVASILTEFGPLTKEEIIEKVSKQRLVKQTTVNLALMNKSRFRKNDGRYELVK